MTKKQLQNLEACKRNNMVVYRGNRPELANELFLWCKSQKRPYVQIEVKRQRATIMMDCAWLPSRMDEEAKKDVETLMERYGCSRQLPWKTMNIVEEVHLKFAKAFAADLHQVADSFGKRCGIGV